MKILISAFICIGFYILILKILRRHRGTTWYVNNTSSYASDNDLYVDQGKSWGYPFATLDCAIKRCSKYDTILVGSGHCEFVDCDITIDMDKPIRIVGSNINRPTFTIERN